MEVESDSNKVVVEEGDNVIVPTPSFLVNSDIIESVQIENQSEELRALGLTVYDQSKFEEGILKQVDAALEEQEKLQSLKNKPVTGKQNRKKIFDDVAPNKVQNETEKEKLVRLGQMTPFGTMLTGTKITSQELTSFEKYLLEQEKLRNLKSQHTSKKGKSLKSPTASKEKVVHVLEPTSTTSKSNLTKKKKKNSKQFPDTSSSRKRKSSKDDEEEWNTDDSDWEYSDEETPSKKKKKRKNQADKVIDDGNVEDYQQRLRDWELDDAIVCEEFEGGLKIPSMIWDQLYNYQKVGIRWMYELRLQRCGGILGDEMGLGKTIQIVAFLAALSHSKILNRLSTYRGLGPVLLVAPATVMHQWVKEIHKWWPPLRVAIMHESGSYDGTKNALIKSINKANGIIITSYAGVVQNSEQLLALDWDYVILDEGHKIRNPDAQATLVVKQFRTCNRFILSGSPMQNNLKELWSLFDFVFPGKLGTLPVFMQNFSIPITQGGYSNASQVEVATAFKCATVLKETINPYLLRRMKADVKDHLKLPEKNEQVLFCRLTPEQRAMYQAYLDSGEIKSIIEGRLQIFIGLTNLRKICNHPDLFQKNGNEDASNPRAYIESSGKLLVVDSLLKIWKEQNHRVLLFSQSRQMLDIMETFVKQHNYSYLRLDGNTGIGSRQPMIQKFNTNPDIFVFLLTTKVGGLGVNLTGANRVIIYDPDWNPSTDLQARERAWRIGQKKDVTVYRLLMSGTIEEKIYHRQIFKQYLTNRVLNDPKQRRFFKSNDLHELFTLKETNNQLTETEAIFAGTESEVATNPYEVPETNKSSKLDKANEDDWMRQWKKKRDEREAEWNKSLEKKKRKEEIKSLNETEEQRRKRKKKEAKEKKKKKQIKVDGEKVKHVVKVSSYCPAVDLDNESAQSSSNQDDYVLQRLFAKTGVMSALRHDSIVDAGNPDYALVEGEAERVAKEAIKELKNSRRNCWGADSGVPTWTGLNGAVRAPDMAEPSIPKPRFGLKKKNVNPAPTITPSTSILKSVEAETPTTSQPESVESVPNSWNSTAFSSQDLLNRMAKRNRLLGLPKASDDEDSNSTFQSTNEEESLILNTQTSPLEFAPEVDFRTMMDDIRNFVAFRGVNPGQVFTDDLLAEFNDKMPSRGAPLFRALLSQLCTFTRDVHNRGIWQLKPKFQ